MGRKVKLVAKAIWLEFAEWFVTLLILAVFCLGIFAVFCVAAQFIHWVGGFMSEGFKSVLPTILIVVFGAIVVSMLVYETVTAIQCRYQRLVAAEDAEIQEKKRGGIFGKMYEDPDYVENTLTDCIVEGDFIGGNKNV